MPPGKGVVPLGKLSDGLAALLDEVEALTWPSGHRRARGRRSRAGALLTWGRACRSGLCDPVVLPAAVAAETSALADDAAAWVGAVANVSDGWDPPSGVGA